MVKGKAEKEEKKVPEAVDTFEGFEFMNQLKYERAVATVGDLDKAALLAEYDRIGGFIRYNGNKVINGAFWDSKRNVRVESPAPKMIKRQEAVVEETIEVAPIEAPKEKKAKTE